MIDEKRLDEFEVCGRVLQIRFTAMKPEDPSIPENPEEFKRKLIRLARLGRRAEKHAVPVLQLLKMDSDWSKEIELANLKRHADAALAALPKDKK